jgi:hypothetical protein
MPIAHDIADQLLHVNRGITVCRRSIPIQRLDDSRSMHQAFGSTRSRHGEDETGKNFGRHYMLLEGTDARFI